MRRTICMILTAAAVLTLTGCGGGYDTYRLYPNEFLLGESVSDSGEVIARGFISRGENCVILDVFCDRDDNGNAIYNRQDFIDRAAENPDFAASYLGADSAVFSEGRETQLAGRSFYCYPMTMTAGGREFSGQVCLANADETGVYLLFYGVRDGSPAAEELTQLCQASLESISFN